MTARANTTAQDRPHRDGSPAHDTLDIPGLFAARGLRRTRQRERVFSALAASKSHPTAEELHRSITAHPNRFVGGAPAARRANHAEGVSLATVYNSLEALCRAGMARRLPSASVASVAGAGSGARYEADLHDHLHLTLADGGVVDLPEDLSARLLSCVSPELVREVERRTGVRIARVSVELFQARVGSVASIGHHVARIGEY